MAEVGSDERAAKAATRTSEVGDTKNAKMLVEAKKEFAIFKAAVKRFTEMVPKGQALELEFSDLANQEIGIAGGVDAHLTSQAQKTDCIVLTYRSSFTATAVYWHLVDFNDPKLFIEWSRMNVQSALRVYNFRSHDSRWELKEHNPEGTKTVLNSESLAQEFIKFVMKQTKEGFE